MDIQKNKVMWELVTDRDSDQKADNCDDDHGYVVTQVISCWVLSTES